MKVKTKKFNLLSTYDVKGHLTQCPPRGYTSCGISLPTQVCKHNFTFFTEVK